MDYRGVRDVIESWPVEDRVRLVHDVWEHLQEQGQEPDMTDDLKAELDRRIEEMDRKQGAGVPWEVAKDRILVRFEGRRSRSSPVAVGWVRALATASRH